MNIVDVVIIALVLLALLDGAVNGVFVTFGKYAGAVTGLFAGAIIAAALVTHFELDRTSTGFLVAALLVLGLVAVGYAFGVLVGTPLRELMASTRLTGLLDALLGAALSVVVILFAAYTVATVLDRGPNTTTAQLVQQSTLVRRLDSFWPSPPAFITNLERAIATNIGPNVFGGLEPSLPGSIGIDPSAAATPGVRTAADRVSKIESRGCGGILYGSGFPISADEILTNAHVVAGTRQTGVRTVDGRLHAAEVILFDPDRDVAVLRVDGLGADPLAVRPQSEARHNRRRHRLSRRRQRAGRARRRRWRNHRQRQRHLRRRARHSRRLGRGGPRLAR